MEIEYLKKEEAKMAAQINRDIPAGHKVDPAVYSRMKKILEFYLWLKGTPGHDDVQIFGNKSLVETCGFMRVEVSHLDMWNHLLHTKFVEAMEVADGYEIYPGSEDNLFIDISFNSLYVPDEEAE